MVSSKKKERRKKRRRKNSSPLKLCLGVWREGGKGFGGIKI